MGRSGRGRNPGDVTTRTDLSVRGSIGIPRKYRDEFICGERIAREGPGGI